MRHIRIVFLVVVMLAGMVAAGGGGAASAQEATPVAAAEHPLVGTWIVDTDPDDPTNPFHLAVFSADGTLVNVAPVGGFEVGSAVGAGVWESTGSSSAYVTFWQLGNPEVTIVIRAELDVAPGALEFSGTYNAELVNPDGIGTGQFGPGMVEGTKMIVEPPGVPVGTTEDLFELEATPEG